MWESSLLTPRAVNASDCATFLGILARRLVPRHLQSLTNYRIPVSVVALCTAAFAHAFVADAAAIAMIPSSSPARRPRRRLLRSSLPTLLAVLPFLSALRTAAATAAAAAAVAVAPIPGTIEPHARDHAANLSVLVTSGEGFLVEVVPVTAAHTFALLALPARAGLHVVSVAGSTHAEFNPIIVDISDGALALAYARDAHKRAITIPDGRPLPGDATPPPLSGDGIGNDDADAAAPRHAALHFAPARNASFEKLPRSRLRFLNLWRYRSRIMQLLAVGFIVWFPRFFRKLPAHIREELLGEKDPDLGDPNRVIKALLNEEALVKAPSSDSTRAH